VFSLIKERAARKPKKDIVWKDVAHSPHQQRPAAPQRPATTRRPPPIPQTRGVEKPRSQFEEVLSDLFEAAGVPTQREQRKSSQPAQKKAPPQIQQSPSRPKLSEAEQAALARLEKQKRPPRPKRAGAGSSIGVARLLRSKDAARDAIIAAEILGPPRGLRPMVER